MDWSDRIQTIVRGERVPEASGPGVQSCDRAAMPAMAPA